MNLPPIKPTPPPPKPTTTTTALKGECSNCGIKDRWLIHRVLLRGVDRRLCTSCVLRLHPSSFCPWCFEFFEHPLSATSSASAHRFISCVKCSSLTHLRCLPSPPPPPSSFLCPPCSKSNFSFFPIPNPNHVFDQKLSLVLLCAAKIASTSAARALGVARARADRTVREAAAARKRAKEALERVDKVKRVEGSIEVSGSRNLGTNHKVMCKKEDLNGFVGHKKVKVSSEVLPLPHNGLSVAVNNNGAPQSVVRGNGNAIVKDKHGNDEDLERVQNCHGRIVDVSST